MAYRMFAGELDGQLVLSHFGFRARDVRESVAKMFVTRNLQDWPWRRRVTVAWADAKKAGWRVAPVIVSAQQEWHRIRDAVPNKRAMDVR